MWRLSLAVVCLAGLTAAACNSKDASRRSTASPGPAAPRTPSGSGATAVARAAAGSFRGASSAEVKELRDFVPPKDAVLVGAAFSVDFKTGERPLKPLEITLPLGVDQKLPAENVYVLVVIDHDGPGRREVLLDASAFELRTNASGGTEVVLLSYAPNAVYAVVTGVGGRGLAGAVTAPTSPEAQMTDLAPSASAIEVRWTAVPGAASYVVAFREADATPQSCADGQVEDVGSATSFTAPGLAPSTQYAFAICAVGASDVVSTVSRPLRLALATAAADAGAPSPGEPTTPGPGGEPGAPASGPGATPQNPGEGTGSPVTPGPQPQPPSPGPGSGSAPVPQEILVVERRYPNTSTVDSWLWNYYVDAATTTNDCAGGLLDPCIHAGESRRVVVTPEASCDGLTAVDALDVFAWRCVVEGGKAVFQTDGFRTGKGLKNLLESTSFKTNLVTVSGSGGPYTSPATVWWTNVVEPLPAAPSVQSLSNEAHIYTLATSATANGYFLDADRIALVTLPGATMSWGGSTTPTCESNYGSPDLANLRCQVSVGGMGGRRFAWVEGRFASGDHGTNSADIAVFLASAIFSVVHGSTLTTAEDGTFDGIRLFGTRRSLIRDVELVNFSHSGIAIDGGSDSNRLQSARILGGAHGIDAKVALETIMTDIVAYSRTVSAGAAGINLQPQSFRTVVAGATISGFDYCIAASSENIVLSNVYATDCGYAFNLSANNVLSNSTAADATNAFATSSVSVTVKDFLAFNASNGMTIGGSSSSFHDLAVFKALTGIDVNATEGIMFKGRLLSGGASTACMIPASPATNLNASSGNCSSSDAGLTITNGIDLTNAFKGLVTDGDPVNADSVTIDAQNGLVPYAQITDYTHFAVPGRIWGPGLSADVASPQNRPFWDRSTNPAGLWDWSLAATSSIVRAIHGPGACPDGEDFIVHTWSDSTTTRILQHAFERMNDGLGDDDGLCESGETCVFAPNIGAYQGHGKLVPSSAKTGCANIGAGGTIQNVTLVEYETNGY